MREHRRECAPRLSVDAAAVYHPKIKMGPSFRWGDGREPNEARDVANPAPSSQRKLGSIFAIKSIDSNVVNR